MMKVSVLIITILVSNIATAQDFTRIKVEAGRLIADVITPSIRYRYPGFRQGTVVLKDKTSYTSSLNYNFLSGEIDFISPQRDTLAIANDLMLNIDHVSIDTSTFFYNKGYLEVIKKSRIGSVVKKQVFAILSSEKIGAYNMSSPTSAIDTYNSYMDRSGTVYNLTARENITLKLKTEYFFGNEFNLFLPASKRSLDKLYVSKKQAIETYLKNHPVNFNSEEDLARLFMFLSGSSN